MDRDYNRNLDDERIVDLSEEDDLDAPPPTLDPDERLEYTGSEFGPPNDDDRTERPW